MIRRAVAADAAVLAALNTEVQALHVAWAPERYREADPAEVVRFFEGLLAREDVVIALAEADEPLGYAVGSVLAKDSPFKHPRVTMALDQIGVRAAARERGVGRALMAWIEGEARARGCGGLHLDVLAVNEGARAFYARLGYAPEHLRYAKLVPGGAPG